jgi:triacylglycerol esterase/lipase EstA (alpha/beta hydrolase family)
VRKKLSRWQQIVPDAQVIYICHSMGGLIARYYLDVLGGHATARRLITIGTKIRLRWGTTPESRHHQRS